MLKNLSLLFFYFCVTKHCIFLLLFFAIVDDCEILAVPPSSSNKKANNARQKINQPNATIDVVTVEDPITGEPVKQLVQTVTDASTGKTVQIPLPNIQADNLDEGWIFLNHTTLTVEAFLEHKIFQAIHKGFDFLAFFDLHVLWTPHQGY